LGHIPRILLVDDNPVNLKVAKMLLEKEGVQVDSVMDGETAFSAIQNTSYQMVLMDVQLPGMDGLETTRQIRQWEMSSTAGNDHPRTPIIALTAADQEEEQQACLVAGMDDVILKPLRPDKIKKALQLIFVNHMSNEKLSTNILNKLKEKEESTSSTPIEASIRHLVTFSLGNEKYAFDMDFMKKIRWAEGITPVPGLPPHIPGIINLRGEIISVVDLKALLGISSKTPSKATIMVTSMKGVDVGFLVDSVDEIIDLPSKSIDPPMITFEKEYSEFIDGETRMDESLVVILNYRKIMTSEKMNIHKK
jgi:chemotaxis signal transduction protein/CheY-like chemotaxis protein